MKLDWFIDDLNKIKQNSIIQFNYNNQVKVSMSKIKHIIFTTDSINNKQFKYYYSKDKLVAYWIVLSLYFISYSVQW